MGKPWSVQNPQSLAAVVCRGQYAVVLAPEEHAAECMRVLIKAVGCCAEGLAERALCRAPSRMSGTRTQAHLCCLWRVGQVAWALRARSYCSRPRTLCRASEDARRSTMPQRSSARPVHCLLSSVLPGWFGGLCQVLAGRGCAAQPHGPSAEQAPSPHGLTARRAHARRSWGSPRPAQRSRRQDGPALPSCTLVAGLFEPASSFWHL